MAKVRRSVIYVPANAPAFINTIPIFCPDVICLDLEDSVPITEKNAARNLLKYAIPFLREQTRSEIEIMVRINSVDTPFFFEDINVLKYAPPDSIRLPKVESETEILNLAEKLKTLEKSISCIKKIEIIPVIETVKGLYKIEEIINASDRITGITFGAEDFTKDIGTKRSKSGEELLYARERIVLACKLKKIDAIDTVFPDINDLEGLKKETEFVKQLGFTGKSLIHPSQIEIVNTVFIPTAEEIEKAKSILFAVKIAEKEGTGVISYKGRMVDLPVIEKALNILKYAHKVGIKTEVDLNEFSEKFTQ